MFRTITYGDTPERKRFDRSFTIDATRLDTFTFLADNIENGHTYAVTCNPITNEWSCACPDHKYRNTICKHIWAVWRNRNYARVDAPMVDPVYLEINKNLQVSPTTGSKQLNATATLDGNRLTIVVSL